MDTDPAIDFRAKFVREAESEVLLLLLTAALVVPAAAGARRHLLGKAHEVLSQGLRELALIAGREEAHERICGLGPCGHGVERTLRDSNVATDPHAPHC